MTFRRTQLVIRIFLLGSLISCIAALCFPGENSMPRVILTGIAVALLCFALCVVPLWGKCPTCGGRIPMKDILSARHCPLCGAAMSQKVAEDDAREAAKEALKRKKYPHKKRR